MTSRSHVIRMPIQIPRDGSPVGAIGILITLLAMATTGPLGLGLGVALGLLWLASPPIVVFFLGHLLVLALWSAGQLTAQWPVHAGLVLVLAGPLTTVRPAPGRTLVAFTLSTLGVLAIVGITLSVTGSIIEAGLILVVTTAVIAYALHRYERLALDLIDT